MIIYHKNNIKFYKGGVIQNFPIVEMVINQKGFDSLTVADITQLPIKEIETLIT